VLRILLGRFIRHLQRRQEAQHREYSSEPVHPCLLFRERWHCSPRAELSGFVAELAYGSGGASISANEVVVGKS
jgi:hypothetical protein